MAEKVNFKKQTVYNGIIPKMKKFDPFKVEKWVKVRISEQPGLRPNVTDNTTTLVPAMGLKNKNRTARNKKLDARYKNGQKKWFLLKGSTILHKMRLSKSRIKPVRAVQSFQENGRYKKDYISKIKPFVRLDPECDHDFKTKNMKAECLNCGAKGWVGDLNKVLSEQGQEVIKIQPKKVKSKSDKPKKSKTWKNPLEVVGF